MLSFTKDPGPFIGKMHFFKLGLIIALLTSCAGYRPVSERNPLAPYGIKRVAVPLFINDTIYPSVSGPFTREIISVLKQYSDLTVLAGENETADAVLVGILESPERRSIAYKTDSRFYLGNSDLAKSVSPRKPYGVPSSTSLKMGLRLILIKDPEWAKDAKMVSALTEIASQSPGAVMMGPKIIFNTLINLSASYSRALQPNTSPDQGGVTNATKNDAEEEKALESAAQTAGRNFSELVLNAF